MRIEHGAPDKVDARHLRGFRRIQRMVLAAFRDEAAYKDYRSLAAAYKDAVAGERLVLKMEGPASSDWPDEMIVRWVDDEFGAAGCEIGT